MNLYHSKTYRDDLNAVIIKNPWLKAFERKSIFITGATGLVCSAVADLLFFYSELTNGSVSLYVAGRDRERVSRRFSQFVDSPFFHYVEYDANKSNLLDFSVDYILHGASNAFPAAIYNHPVATMKENFMGMLELLEYGCKHHTKNIVFISSSEVYGIKEFPEPYREDEYGYIDVLNPRSSYAVAKRAAETLCASFVHEKNINISIVRPGHIYGPTASRKDNRVASAFAYNAVDGKDIILKSSGNQIRSYCYMMDCATAILKVALEGKPATAYNISNPKSVMSIKEMASLYAEYGGVPLKYELPDVAESAAFNPMQNSALNSERLCALGWRGLFNSQEGIGHTVKILREAEGFE